MGELMAVNRPLTGNIGHEKASGGPGGGQEWPLMAVKKTLTDNTAFIFKWLRALFCMAVNGRYCVQMPVNGQVRKWPNCPMTVRPLMAVKKTLTAIKSMKVNRNFSEKLAVNLGFALTANNPFGIKYLMAVNGKTALTANNPFGIKYLMAVKTLPLKGECFLNGHSPLGLRQVGAQTPCLEHSRVNENALINQFDAAGIRVEIQADSRHWKLYYKGIVAGYWPNTGTCYVYGKSFKPSVDGLIKALKSGRITMPEDAGEATCKSCGEPVWWIKTPAGKNMPLNASGESHWGTCPSADQHRKPAPARPAAGGRP